MTGTTRASGRVRRSGFYLVAAAAWLSVADVSAAERSVWAGVYSAEQAERGAEVWRVECVKCHEVEEFTSPLFLLTWSGSSLGDLFEQLRITMPQDNPGNLTRRELVELVAYMLRENGVPEGSAELATEAESLQAIRIERTPPN